MTRQRLSTAARVDQVAAILAPDGVTTAQIAGAIGISTESRISAVLKEAVAAGRAFRTTARVSKTMSQPEAVYFPTAESRDAFAAAYLVNKRERRKAADRERAFTRRGRDRTAEIAKRAAKRAEARELREANAIAKAIQKRAQQVELDQRAIRLGEAEQRKERKRLDREAAAAAKAREKAEAVKTKKRLQAETREAGILAKVRGTATLAVAKPKGPAHIVGELDLSRAKVTVAPRPPERFAANDVPSVVSSAQCRKWAEAVAA